MKWGKGICIGLLLCIAAAGAYAMTTPVGSLPEGCMVGTTACTKTSDVTSGTCRTIKYSSSAGTIQDQICDKGSAYELYRQAAPNTAFSACVGGGCVDQSTGFVRFTSTTLSTRVRAVRSCIPVTEVCDGKDNDCDGLTDENNVCAAPADTAAPVISNGAPSGTLAAGTTSTTLRVTTNENAMCGYSSTAGTSYAYMTQFSTTGTTSSSTTISGLADGKSYTFAVKCKDAAGNVNTADYAVAFSVAAPTCVASTEVCDGKDNNCNGQVDENNVCAPTTTATSSLLSGSSAGAWGQTRDGNFETLVDSWFKSPNVIQRIPTSQGTALWVPWMKSSSSSSASDLQSGTNCAIGTVDLNNNCLVTDEFSQVGMVLAMSSRHQADFDQWVTTVRQLKGTKYGSLPVWKASRSATGISTAITGNQDSASDADARVIIALYTAANNDAFTSTQKASYRQLADTMAADFIKYDFMHVSKPGLNGVTINNFPASGGAVGTGNGMTWGSADYAGYAGDRAIALLAAYRSTGNSVYLDYARDNVNAYLLAANFNGAGFSVPPKSYSWDLSGTTPKAVCSSACSGTWDDSDAVRAVTLCKALYYAQLNNVDLGSGLKSYCQAWMASGGVKSNAYAIQYTFGGAPSSPVQGGMYENGLGSSLNFNLNKADLAVKLDEVASHYDPTRGTFDYTPSDGVYRSAFYKVNLGSAIGRDLKAFSGTATTATPPAPTCTPTTEVCDGKDNNCDGRIDENNVCAPPAPACAPTAEVCDGKDNDCNGLVDENNVCAPPTPTATGVAGLNVVCSQYAGGPLCATVSDTNDGSCRTLKYTSAGSAEQVMICDKGTAYEMYDQVHAGQTTTCVGTNCVGPLTGYARWAK